MSWPHDTVAPGRPCRAHDLNRAMQRKADDTAGLCGHCGGECATPQACEQPDNSRPRHKWPMRAWHAARSAVTWVRVALLRWQLECVRDERARYEGLGWASPIFTRNCLEQEADLIRRIRRLES